MKKYLYVAASLLAMTAGAAMAEDAKKIIYASYLSPQHITNPVLEKFFADITAQTNGSVTFESHVGGSLLSGRDIPGGVRDGIADAGYFVGSYIPAEMPVDNYIAEFSLWNDKPLLMTAVTNDLILNHCDECAEEYAKFNTQFLATYALTPYVYHCTSELTKLADFQGKRLRGISGYADLAVALGASPVNVSPDEAYEALDRGVIDCALHSVAAQKARSYGEAAKFVIMDPLGGYLGASTFNLNFDKWNELTVEERNAVRDHLAELATGAVFNYIAEDEKVIEEYTKTGTKFYHADPEFPAKVEEFKASYLPQVIEKGRKLGVKNPEEIAKQIEVLTEKWTKLLEENGSDRETFQRLLHEEIFSKLDTSKTF